MLHRITKLIIIILTILIIVNCKNGTKSKNESPVISSIIANPSTLGFDEVSVITCNATDPEGDNLTYNWQSTHGTISGDGTSINWRSPNTEGTYTVSCSVEDENGGKDNQNVDIVVENTNESPVISSIIANPSTLGFDEVSVITCNATDPEGDNLTYNWQSTHGTISGDGTSINWRSPNTEGTYTVSCSVEDENGGEDNQNIDIVVDQPTPANCQLKSYRWKIEDTGGSVLSRRYKLHFYGEVENLGETKANNVKLIFTISGNCFSKNSATCYGFLEGLSIKTLEGLSGLSGVGSEGYNCTNNISESDISYTITWE
ncbi:hypothetical protein HNV12_26600 [Methanococcoides sp. SA1]|nr:hypothetical protein [Methanococcoides sp. SA1]